MSPDLLGTKVPANCGFCLPALGQFWEIVAEMLGLPNKITGKVVAGACIVGADYGLLKPIELVRVE
jgi:hypothetical protein